VEGPTPLKRVILKWVSEERRGNLSNAQGKKGWKPMLAKNPYRETASAKGYIRLGSHALGETGTELTVRNRRNVGGSKIIIKMRKVGREGDTLSRVEP